ATVPMRRTIAAGNLEQILLPGLSARLRFQTEQGPGGAQGVDPAAIHHRSRPWSGPGSRHAAARESRVSGVVTVVAKAPALLPRGRVQADDDLLLLILGLSEHLAVGHNDRREAAGQP